MINKSVVIWMVATVLFMAAGQGFGYNQVVYFNDGGTHNISNGFTSNEVPTPLWYDDVWVDYQAPGMQTTVNILSGWDGDGFKAYEDSRINLSGGRMDEPFRASSNSQVTISDEVSYWCRIVRW
jgi:hypothetical protein